MHTAFAYTVYFAVIPAYLDCCDLCACSALKNFSWLCRTSRTYVTLPGETSPPIGDALQGAFNLAWLGLDNRKNCPLPTQTRAAVFVLADQPSTLSAQ